MTIDTRTPATSVATSLDRTAIPAVWARYTDLLVDHGEGSWLITTDGERYLDYSSGIGVTNTGHAHPHVAEAIAEQAHKLLHGQQNIPQGVTQNMRGGDTTVNNNNFFDGMSTKLWMEQQRLARNQSVAEAM